MHQKKGLKEAQGRHRTQPHTDAQHFVSEVWRGACTGTSEGDQRAGTVEGRAMVATQGSVRGIGLLQHVDRSSCIGSPQFQKFQEAAPKNA